jgi:hypothetical protein
LATNYGLRIFELNYLIIANIIIFGQIISIGILCYQIFHQFKKVKVDTLIEFQAGGEQKDLQERGEEAHIVSNSDYIEMQSGQTVTEYLSKSNFQMQESGGLYNQKSMQRFWNEAVEDQRGGDILNQTNSSHMSRNTPRRDGVAPSVNRSTLLSKSSDRDKKLNASGYSYANVSQIIQQANNKNFA